MRRLKRKIDECNTQLFDPVGLHILWPQKVAFLFVSDCLSVMIDAVDSDRLIAAVGDRVLCECFFFSQLWVFFADKNFLCSDTHLLF